jgi:hypothetical protein
MTYQHLSQPQQGAERVAQACSKFTIHRPAFGPLFQLTVFSSGRTLTCFADYVRVVINERIFVVLN